VDDHPDARGAVRDLLIERGCTVVAEAACASDALHLAERLSLDGLVIDVELGEDCGFALARELIRADAGLAVLLVSGHRQHCADARAEASGARGFALEERLLDLDLERLLRRASP
jgi:DNA-binding NarL/FixJ family response regulator